MNVDDFDVEVFVRQNAALSGLVITPEQMPGVLANIRRIVPMARLFLDYPVDDEVEIASVYVP
ncbi:MAG: DUF4089 domain-containing protein [Alphaproteobacteria bacterium]|nr:DUF4089 domain-containing protein [Alphaproteobacteria bacterium]